MVENGITNSDKLLICLALILLLTIVWTILIGILYKMNERKYMTRKKKIIIDDDDDDDNYEYEDEIIYRNSNYKSNKKVLKQTKKTNLETYVKVRFYRSNKTLIYVAPKNVVLHEGQKVKVRVDDDTVRTAVVVKGNYTREKYKNYEYFTLDIVTD